MTRVLALALFAGCVEPSVPVERPVLAPAVLEPPLVPPVAPARAGANAAMSEAPSYRSIAKSRAMSELAQRCSQHACTAKVLERSKDWGSLPVADLKTWADALRMCWAECGLPP